MRPIQSVSSGVLAELIRRQPPSRARTSLAWQLAVGPTLARLTSVELERGTLTVRGSDRRWIAEISRARDVILPRLQQLLGPDQVARLDTHD